MEIFKANKQWAVRPPDEKFASVQELHDACKHYADLAREKRGVPFSDIRVEDDHGDVALVGKAKVPAKFTNWAFSQLCARIGAPAWYLRELGTTLACNNINYGLARRVADTAVNSLANLMFHENGGLILRSIMTDDYARIWNWEVTERLLGLQGWEPAGVDIRGKSDEAKENFDLYASDHDMFAFLCNRNLTVAEAGSDGAMYKGVIVENSEVGASALKLTRFLYRAKCGNHIIWGASKVLEIKVRHVGNARNRWSSYFAEVKRYADESVSDLEWKIAQAKTKLIADTKEGVLDAIFGKRVSGLTKKYIAGGYDAVNEQEDGDARTVWGFSQGLTRYSQTIPFADQRTDIDRAAGRILDFAF